ncbi:efflux RND transporter permease subunit [Curvibacter gracilis]|uniref:efflux RND transporter permease subunit n=1 Tax=Curvibacter gracilis TaxID=230310 RepID=UPI0004B98557|nr:efflux RND transporter permease subunit [Curvibacter gracilis]
MNFSAWAIHKPTPTLLLFILLTVLGFLGLHQLGIQKFPDMDLPTIKISATLEGAAPAQLETEVARKIENKLASISRLDHVTTTISDGAVAISVSFDIAKNAEEALNEVRNAVDSVKAELPTAMAAPTVAKVSTAGSALLTYTVQSDRLNEFEASWFVDNNIAKAMLAVKGVAQVQRVGGVDREIQVDLDPAAMAGLQVNAANVSSLLKSIEKDYSGGRGEVGGARQSMRILGAAASAQDIAALTLPLADGRRVRLDQVARISDTHAERSTRAYYNGKPVIGFQITRSKGFSDEGVARSVRAAVAEFAAANPHVTIQEAYNTVTPVEENYKGSMQLLYEGAALAVVVVWWFLRDKRATLISAAALPISMVPTFAVMQWAGFSLNTVSLLALALVVGILVDDAIVEVENIVRHLKAGKSPKQAAEEAAGEIGLAVIATTLTLAAVFLPTAFMGGIPGLIFRQFGITAATAVLMSLLVARLLTPMMAAYFLKAPTHEEAPDGPIMRRYLGWVNLCLSHRKTTVAVAAAIFALSLALMPLIHTEFFPAGDDGQVQLTLTLPPGSTLDNTSAVALQAADIARQLPEVSDVFISAGTASSGDGMGASSTADVTSAVLTLNLTPHGERHRKQSEVESDLRQRLRVLSGTRVSVGNGMSGTTLTLTLASDDPGALSRAANAVEKDLRGLQGLGNVTSSAALQQPEVQVLPDFARAAALGVATSDLADLIRVATNGDFSTSLAKLNLPQRQVAVRVRLDPAVRSDLATLAQMRLPATNGSVALASVAEVQMGSSPAQINRIDRERNVTLTIELNGQTLGDVNRAVMNLPSVRKLPPGVHTVAQGDLQRMSEMFGSFGMAMAIGVFCIYGVLVLLFHDFLQPATILAALPLSLSGAVAALLITGSSFSMPTVIGFVLLMGIVTKNSILLVEYAIMARRDHGMTRHDALVDACHKRARPIVMTTIALTAGMLPIALGLGADPSFRQPMAIVVIGGGIASTALSLLVIPTVFTYVDDLMIGLRGWFTRRVSS